MKTLNKTDYLRSAFFFFLFLVFSLLIVNKFCILHFDGAMNYQVVKSVVEEGKYASLYHDYSYNGTEDLLFDHKIQTGSPIIFLSSILDSLFGMDPFHMQMVLCFFWVGLLYILFLHMWKSTGIFLAIGTIFFLIPHTAFNPVYGYGEMSMAFFLVSSLSILCKAREQNSPALWFACGVISGLGYLTKTVFLICIPTFIAFFVFDYFKKKFQNYFIILAGFLLPVLSFEIYKLISLGNVDKYINWWIQEISCIRTESGTRDVIENLTVRIADNIKWYSNTFNVWSWLTILSLVGPAVMFVVSRIKKWKVNSVFVSFYLCYMTYMAWWLLIVTGPRLSERRIMTAFCLMIVVMVYSTDYISSHISLVFHKYVKVFILLLLITAGFLRFNKTLDSLIDAYSTKKATDEAVEFLNTVEENATFWGRGWWQNPVIAAEKGIVIHNLYTEELSQNSYFIEDVFMKINSDTLDEVKRNYHCVQVFGNDKYTIWRIAQYAPQPG